MNVSDDQGKTSRRFNTTVHVDHHAMWIDPKDNNHMLIGEDGGLAQTRDRGVTWQHINSLPIGQFYAVAFDFRKPYWVYGGLQDNGTWASPTQTTGGGPTPFDAYTYAGGDGFHVQIDPEDWATAYAESQGGGAQRTDLQTGAGRGIRPNAGNTVPRPAEGERWRFNWSTPIVLSPHNSERILRRQSTVPKRQPWRYVGSDQPRSHDERSFEDEPRANSATPENTGAEAHCTIITISESPIRDGLDLGGHGRRTGFGHPQ